MLLRIEVCVVALEHERGIGCAASRLVERVIARPELLGVRLALEKLLILAPHEQFWSPRHTTTRRRGPWYVWHALAGNGAFS